MYDLLMSSDMMVHDPDSLAETLISKLGIYGHPRWRQAFPNHTYIAHFLRAHKWRAIAPTLIEPQGHLDKPNVGDPFFPEFLKSLEDFQGRHRPMKTHATVLIMENIGELVERLERRKVPFRIAASTPEMTWERLWIGATPENAKYNPSYDGGLCIEVTPTWPLQLPPETFHVPPPELEDPKPGEMIRVVARGFLVRDIDDVARQLAQNLALEPTGQVVDVPGEGYKRLRYGFKLTQSATLDLIQATRWNSESGTYLHSWGPGPYYTRIAVHDLAAKAEDLRERGTKFTLHPECDAVGGRALLRVDMDELQGHLFEFVEYEGPSAG